MGGLSIILTVVCAVVVAIIIIAIAYVRIAKHADKGMRVESEFDKFDKKINELEFLRKKARNNAQSEEYRAYNALFWELYDKVLELESSEKIDKEPEKKNIGYLKEILENDGPEYSYTIEFWSKDEIEKKYRIGVCVRGWPILEIVKI